MNNVRKDIEKYILFLRGRWAATPEGFHKDIIKAFADDLEHILKYGFNEFKELAKIQSSNRR